MGCRCRILLSGVQDWWNSFYYSRFLLTSTPPSQPLSSLPWQYYPGLSLSLFQRLRARRCPRHLMTLRRLSSKHPGRNKSVTPRRMPQLPEPAAHGTQQEKYVVSLVIDSLVIIIIYYSQYSASYVNNKSCSLWQP